MYYEAFKNELSNFKQTYLSVNIKKKDLSL